MRMTAYLVNELESVVTRGFNASVQEASQPSKAGQGKVSQACMHAQGTYLLYVHSGILS